MNVHVTASKSGASLNWRSTLRSKYSHHRMKRVRCYVGKCRPLSIVCWKCLLRNVFRQFGHGPENSRLILYGVRHIKCYRAIVLKLLIISNNVSVKSFSVREGPLFFFSWRKECIAEACMGHESDVFLIKYGIGPVVSMGWHGRAVPKYFHVVHATIFMLVPTPTYNAICAGSFDVPTGILFFSIRDVVQVASSFHENGRANGVKVFRHCSAVEQDSVSSASLLRARKRMSHISPLTLRDQCHI